MRGATAQAALDLGHELLPGDGKARRRRAAVVFGLEIALPGAGHRVEGSEVC